MSNSLKALADLKLLVRQMETELGISDYSHLNRSLLMPDSSNNDLEIHDKKIIFPSQHKNTKFQGCHLLRHGSLDEYPEIFDIPLYWKDCSIKQQLYGFETKTNNPHIGTKELYLQY